MRGRKTEANRDDAPGAEGAQHVGKRVLEVAQRRRPGIQGGQRVDQHDLAVEPGEMIAEERPHHMRLVSLVAPLHHRRHGARRDRVALAERDRRKRQRRRTLEVARHQEASGRQGRERIDVVARPAQIGGELFGDVARRILLRLGVRVETRRAPRAILPTAAREPRSRSREAFRAPIRHRTCRAAAGRAAIRRDSRRGRPTGSNFSPLQRGRALEFDRQAQLRDAPGRLRPAAIGPAEARQMVLVGETRHRVVGLRLEPRPRDPPLCRCGEHRQPRAGDQVADERREEHRLAGARQAGDAQAKAAAGEIVSDRAGDESRLEHKIGENRQSGVRA